MSAIDNSGLTNYRDRTSTAQFNPELTYVYNAGAATVTVTAGTSGTTELEKVHVRVHDKFGGEVRGQITTPLDSGETDNVVIDVSSLDRSKPLDITATAFADDSKTVADMGAYNIGAAGTIGNADKQNNA